MNDQARQASRLGRRKEKKREKRLNINKCLCPKFLNQLPNSWITMKLD